MSVTSVVSICNSALIKLGAERISSINEDVKAAILCKEQYYKSRDNLLRNHNWNFATIRVSLGRDSEAPAFGFSYRYQIPTDCVKVVSVYPDSNHQIEGRYILSNESSLSAKYISNGIDVAYYDMNFVEALALRLAIDLCWSITQSNEREQNLKDTLKTVLPDSRSTDAQEGEPPSYVHDTWLDSRLVGPDIGLISTDE